MSVLLDALTDDADLLDKPVRGCRIFLLIGVMVVVAGCGLFGFLGARSTLFDETVEDHTAVIELLRRDRRGMIENAADIERTQRVVEEAQADYPIHKLRIYDIDSWQILFSTHPAEMGTAIPPQDQRYGIYYSMIALDYSHSDNVRQILHSGAKDYFTPSQLLHYTTIDFGTPSHNRYIVMSRFEEYGGAAYDFDALWQGVEIYTDVTLQYRRIMVIAPLVTAVIELAVAYQIIVLVRRKRDVHEMGYMTVPPDNRIVRL